MCGYVQAENSVGQREGGVGGAGNLKSGDEFRDGRRKEGDRQNG